MNVVVVESPAKAKTINKYLGSDFQVLASYGHVRDLPPKDGSVRPEDDFAMEWTTQDKAKQRIDEIARAVRNADALYLATDPDREGEAISWHVRQALAEKGALGDVPVRRVVFYEITRDAVLDAMRNARDINRELVEAYLARRALDYLVGFTLSPVLWRKLPGARSAGRVQSVALRLICEREAEIEVFRPQEYWSVDVGLAKRSGETFTARLTHLDGRKLDKLDLGDEGAAKKAVAAIEAGQYTVADVQRKQVRRHPQPPFTTSTLQQEASRKLGFSASRTMRLAQQLYEGVDVGQGSVGLITYMRTDSVTLAGEAIGGARRLIEKQYGKEYLPDSPRQYKTKSRNAQEAHEAIRPTDLWRKPADVRHALDKDQMRLYELIWKRTMACQMESAVMDQVTVTLDAHDGRTQLRATGSVLVFDGFIKVYLEGRDDQQSEENEDDERILPPLETGEPVDKREIKPEQHFTQPPPRYTEASLVKKMEELGIGRPSTYASILQVLQDREYVTLESRRFVPQDRGRIVTAFLSNFFGRYVEYGFTADLENQLDDISKGEIDWKEVLRRFWEAFSAAVEDTKGLSMSQVIEALDENLGPHFFPQGPNGGDPRACPACEDGRMGLKLGKFGAFIGCSNYPKCRYTRPLAVPSEDGQELREGNGEDRKLGDHPETGEPVYLKSGPYGPYVQEGDAPEDKKAPKPKRVSLPKGADPKTIDLDLAVKLLALPREVGRHPEDGEPIAAGIGRYGPYIKHGPKYVSLGDLDDVLTIGLNRAVDLIAEAKQKGGGAAGALRTLGEHPEDGKPVTVHNGRYGPYVKHGKTNASLPKGTSADDIAMERAVELLAARAKKGGAKKAGAKKAGGAKSKSKAAN